MTDIGAELYEAIKAEFDNAVSRDRYIQELAERIQAGKVTPKDISLYAQQLGLLLRRAIEANISADKLPNGQMYYNIAEKILRPSLQTNYDLFNAVAAEIQKSVDKQQGIRIAAQQAELPEERINAVISAASEPGIPEETMLRRMSVPAETVIRSYADDYARANADFRSRAGIDEYIVRRDDGSCCEWCSHLAGRYRYPDEVPKDVYRRHDNCGCIVEHQSGGMRKNVHTKRSGTDEQQREALRELDERKQQQREKIRQAAENAKKPRVLSKAESSRLEAEVLAKRRERLTGGRESGIIESENIQIGKSLGAKALNYTVIDPDTGEEFKFVEGSQIKNPTVFAGKDGVKPLKPEVKEGLSKRYGGDPENWQHAKGIGEIDYYGEVVKAEVHWFQEETAGKHRFKVKEWLFDED